jgi:hypothetical protein
LTAGGALAAPKASSYAAIDRMNVGDCIPRPVRLSKRAGSAGTELGERLSRPATQMPGQSVRPCGAPPT